jgi:hypothetical protein
MSKIKRFLEEVSVQMGEGGEINERVMIKGAEIMAHKIDQGYEAQHDLVDMQIESRKRKWAGKKSKKNEIDTRVYPSKFS